MLALTTLAASAHIHADDASNSADYLYEDCGAFHYNSTGHTAPASLDFHIGFLLVVEAISATQQAYSYPKTLRPSPRAPPIFS